METFAANKDLLFQKIEDYVKTSIHLLKMNAVQKLADVIATLSCGFVLALIATVFALFLNIGLALYLGKLLNEAYLGFLLVSSIYLVTGIIVYIFRNALFTKPMSNMIISKILDDIDLDLDENVQPTKL